MGQYYDILIKQGSMWKHYDRSVNGEYVLAKLMEHSWWLNETVGAVCKKLYGNPSKIVWVGDYSDAGDLVNGMSESDLVKFHRMCYGKRSLKSRTLELGSVLLWDRYLVNHDKMVYLDCSKYYDKSCVKEWCVHPLPLLTAIGNGQGGGDYRGCNAKRVGEWAGDTISVEENIPNTGYTETEVVFKDE